MTAMGFAFLFLTWLAECLTIPAFSIRINGKLEGLFLGKKGVRQGDPISPYLFCICMDVFSKMLDQAFLARNINVHPN